MFFSCFWNFHTLFSYIFWWRVAHVSLNVATNAFLLQIERPQKLTFWGYYSKAKMGECNQSNMCFLDDFLRFMPWTTTHFLEEGVRVSLKVATKGALRGKKTLKIHETKKFETFLINMASLYLVQLHIFWKEVRAFHWKQLPKGLLEVKKNSENLDF